MIYTMEISWSSSSTLLRVEGGFCCIRDFRAVGRRKTPSFGCACHIGSIAYSSIYARKVPYLKFVLGPNRLISALYILAGGRTGEKVWKGAVGCYTMVLLYKYIARLAGTELLLDVIGQTKYGIGGFPSW